MRLKLTLALSLCSCFSFDLPNILSSIQSSEAGEEGEEGEEGEKRNGGWNKEQKAAVN